MAFGQSTGPPASARQLEELLVLLLEAGYSGLRDARGPMGFSQRQAGGRFTRSEADAFIERLRGTGSTPREPVTAAERRRAEQVCSLRQMAPELLAGELQRRGWIVMAP